MKIRVIILTITICFLLVPYVLAKVPYEIAGFKLGDNIEDYHEKLRMETVLPIRYAEFLKEVEIQNIPGYKSGLITYGECAVPGRILRINLKYEDFSREFYNKLLSSFKKRFGRPDRWRGDPFHVLVAWKWSFTDVNGNRISMVLQHNVEDTTRKVGNVLKMSVINFLDEEIDCYEKLKSDEDETIIERRSKSKEHIDWEHFIPR